nr:hypothetical protein CFP56_18796 [Quercus suber]
MEREADEIFCGKGVKRREVLHTGIYLAIVKHSSAINAMWDPDRDRKLGFKFELTEAEEFLHDFKKANGGKVHRLMRPVSPICWTPPNFPLYKVNFDEATFSMIGAAGLGAVVRDHSGNVIGAMIERVQLPSSPAVVEALARRRALFFAKEPSSF